MDPIWKKYDEDKEGALGKDEFYFVIVDFIEELKNRYNIESATNIELQRIVEEIYDETYEVFNRSVDGYIKYS